MQKKIKKLLITIAISLILISSSVNASNFRSDYYWPHQTVKHVTESVHVSADGLYVKFEGEILIDNKIHNKTDWITFTFYPGFSHSDILEDFESSLGLRTHRGGERYTINKKTKCKPIEDINNSRFIYNVSIENLTGWNTVVFSANFTLKNKYKRIREAEYTFSYISSIESENQDLSFHFPNKFEVIHYPNNAIKRYDSNYQRFIIPVEYTKTPIYFVFQDNNELKRIESNIRTTERGWNYLFAIISAFFGFLLAIIYENYFRKDKKIEGNIGIKHYKNHDSIIIKVHKKK